jgi:catalase
MVTPERAIDVINGAFGSHPGSRALHAKGRFFKGTFTASPAAATLTRAAHMQGDPVPVYVRWSDGSGHPGARDDKPDVRGMAVSFRISDGSATDILAQTAPRFPVRTPEDFLELVHASAPGPQQAWRLPRFIATHPRAAGALLANLKAGALKPPRSFALATFFAIHAYKWLDADGRSRWVRYTLAPQAPRSMTPPGKGADFLQAEIAERLAAGPVRFTLEVQVAGPRDDPHDPSSVWASQQRVDVGTVEVVEPDRDREVGSDIVVFDPTRVIDGIELSDDPVLLFRPGVYGISVDRRTKRATPGGRATSTGCD